MEFKSVTQMEDKMKKSETPMEYKKAELKKIISGELIRHTEWILDLYKQDPSKVEAILERCIEVLKENEGITS